MAHKNKKTRAPELLCNIITAYMDFLLPFPPKKLNQKILRCRIIMQRLNSIVQNTNTCA